MREAGAFGRREKHRNSEVAWHGSHSASAARSVDYRADKPLLLLAWNMDGCAALLAKMHGQVSSSGVKKVREKQIKRAIIQGFAHETYVNMWK